MIPIISQVVSSMDLNNNSYHKVGDDFIKVVLRIFRINKDFIKITWG